MYTLDLSIYIQRLEIKDLVQGCQGKHIFKVLFIGEYCVFWESEVVTLQLQEKDEDIQNPCLQ
jgi:hypothetical protein